MFRLNTHMLTLLTLLSCLCACAANSQNIQLNGNHYDLITLRHAPFLPKQKRALVQDLVSRLGSLKLRVKRNGKTTVISPSTNTLKSLSLAMLGGLRIALLSAKPGAEIDIMVRIRGKKPTPVQVIWRLDGQLEIESGRPTTFPARRTPTLKLNFVNGSQQWTAIEQSHVREALALLSPDELAVLRRIPLRRERNKRAGKRTTGGLYEQNGCVARIRMYSAAFAGRHLQFSGSPSRPRSKTIATILHEVAHALHYAPSRSAFCAFEQRNKVLNRRVNQYNRAIKSENSPSQLQALQREKEWIEVESNALQRLGDKANRLSKRGPILNAFATQLGRRRGPTAYGATALEETFAESFALFHSDKAALKRIWPDIVEWFEKGHHLRQ